MTTDEAAYAMQSMAESHIYDKQEYVFIAVTVSEKGI